MLAHVRRKPCMPNSANMEKAIGSVYSHFGCQDFIWFLPQNFRPFIFFLVFWSFMSMGRARLEIQIFFTTFIITYWVSKVSYQVVIGETLLLHEFIINTNFILCTRLDCSVHVLRYQVFFFFFLHMNNNITWFYCAGKKTLFIYCSLTVNILFTHYLRVSRYYSYI